MLTFDQIKTYYTDLERLSPKSMLVEYVQYELLDSIFKQSESADLSFIGGTAIRIAYGGNRFSEDLDFDNFGLSFAGFKGLLAKVIKDMEVKGFSIEFRLVEKMAYHCYIRFPDILTDASLGSHPDEKVLVRIDTVRKERLFSPEIRIINKFDVYRDIVVNPLGVILSQKLMAILGRKREKGRDFYDVSLLWSRAQPDFEYIEKNTGMSRDVFSKAVLARCERLDFSALAMDVEPFLSRVDQSARVRNFLPFIRSVL